MSGFVDLHCHWVSEIDDGARNFDEGVAMLEGLSSLGFHHVVATPHMRPGMFDNDGEAIRTAYRKMTSRLSGREGLPQTSLGSEHFFDSTVISRIHSGKALPFNREVVSPAGLRTSGAILVEFHDLTALHIIEQQLFDLQRAGFIPVIAHPERYRASWKAPEIVERLVNLGSIALLDTAALAGKYGRAAKACARKLMEMEVYDAACSDAHRPADIQLVQKGMQWVREEYGQEEIELLFGSGPRALLEGVSPKNGN